LPLIAMMQAANTRQFNHFAAIGQFGLHRACKRCFLVKSTMSPVVMDQIGDVVDRIDLLMLGSL
jgi:hypothetical protein